jgi:hypothetical protein
VRHHPEDQAIVHELFATGLGGVAFRDDHPLEMLARAAGMLRTAPRFFLGRVRRWVDARLRAELGVGFWRLLAEGLTGRVQVGSLTLTSHHFMSPDELDTELGRARLAACVFRLPHRGEMVPMCRMNAAGVRDAIYRELAAAPEGEAAPEVAVTPEAAAAAAAPVRPGRLPLVPA